MRKLFLSLVATILLPLSVLAADYKEGTHYEVLPGQPTQSAEVMEFFSYYCGHCWHFEAIAEALHEGVKGAKFKQSHVEFLPNRQPKLGRLLTRGFATAQVLKKEHEVSKEIFRRHFIEKKYIQTVSSLRDAFVAVGVKPKEFDDAYNSFPTNSLVAQMAQKAKKYQVRATPTVVVNGKYRVKPSGLNSQNFAADYVKLVNYLITLK